MLAVTKASIRERAFLLSVKCTQLQQIANKIKGIGDFTYMLVGGAADFVG